MPDENRLAASLWPFLTRVSCCHKIRELLQETDHFLDRFQLCWRCVAHFGQGPRPMHQGGGPSRILLDLVRQSDWSLGVRIFRPPGTQARIVLVKSKFVAPEWALVAGILIPAGRRLEPEEMQTLAGVLQLVLARLERAEWSWLAARAQHELLKRQGRAVLLLDTASRPLSAYPSASPLASHLLAEGRAGAFPRCRQSRPPSFSLSALQHTYIMEHCWIRGQPPLDRRYQLLMAVGEGTSLEQIAQERLSRFDLTERELEIAQLILRGLTNQAIAETLFISLDTVKTHCKHIYSKLGIRRRTNLLQVLEASLSV